MGFFFAGCVGCKLTPCSKWCNCNGASWHCSWGSQGLSIWILLCNWSKSFFEVSHLKIHIIDHNIINPPCLYFSRIINSQKFFEIENVIWVAFFFFFWVLFIGIHSSMIHWTQHSWCHIINQKKVIDSSCPQHCDILRRAAEAGGLLVDAMINTLDGSKENSSSVPLMVVENGCGSPCIDLRQVSSELAAAAKDADLVWCSFLFLKSMSSITLLDPQFKPHKLGAGFHQARRTFASFFRFYCIFSNVLYSLQQIVANIESRRNK